MTPITFSTLACPDWQIETVIANAAEYGYDGIEWRGGPEGHLQPDMPASKRIWLRQRCSEAGLTSLAVTAYTSFVSESAKERQANVDELQRYADLAADIGASYIRAFLGELAEGTKLDPRIYEKISECLQVASEYADSLGVKIAVEPHDNFVRSSTVVPILRRVRHPALSVIWDIGNASAAGEEPGEGFELLQDRIAYVQVKDGEGRGSAWQLCPLGQGQVPLRSAFGLLVAHGFSGALSLEWEYAWHPELDPPEVALPAGLRAIRELWAAAELESA